MDNLCIFLILTSCFHDIVQCIVIYYILQIFIGMKLCISLEMLACVNQMNPIDGRDSATSVDNVKTL